MRVLHVIPSISPLRGGPTEVLLSTVRALAGAGVDVHVATTDDHGPGRSASASPHPQIRDGVTFHVFPRWTHFYTVAGAMADWLCRSVPTFDVVHVHALFSFPPVAAALVAQRSRVPYVVRPLGTLNDWGRKRRPLLKRVSMTLLERRILERAAAVQFTTAVEQQESLGWGVRFSSVIIPNIARVPAAVEKPHATGGPTVLFLSRLDPVKGLDLLLPAFADVTRTFQSARLVVAGTGDHRFVDDLKRLACSLRLDASVEWAGFLGGQEREAAYRDADLFVLPSYSENFGMAAAEAMAHRLPVVVSDRVPIHGEIAAADAGRVVPCDRAQLAAALEELIALGRRRREMGDRGRELVERAFSADAVAASLCSLYAEVAR